MRGLNGARTDLSPDLAAQVGPILDRRLRRDSPRPVVVAFSGGGDSLALLLIAHAWAQAAARPLLVLTVDHGLQAASAAWTVACGETAARLGARFEALTWTGPKPARGLPAAARAARHGLIARAAREAGARVILMGHTADDMLEAGGMRAEGSTTPDPREWSPSPVWPEGRGLFLLRPLLGARRAAIRDWLTVRGERWIDDPANDDLRYARSRARRIMAGDPGRPEPGRGEDPALALGRLCRSDPAGGLRLPRAALRAAPMEGTRRVLAVACVCTGGGSRTPAGERLARLAEAVRGDTPIIATLAGARIEADAEAVYLVREAGEAARGGLAATVLSAGRTQVWDGRFEVTSDRDGLEIRRLGGLATHLPRSERRRLNALPAAARAGLPAVVDRAGEVRCPVLVPLPGLHLRPLVMERLLAACGSVDLEPV